jgi:hypothetical protein
MLLQLTFLPEKYIQISLTKNGLKAYLHAQFCSAIYHCIFTIILSGQEAHIQQRKRKTKKRRKIGRVNKPFVHSLCFQV